MKRKLDASSSDGKKQKVAPSNVKLQIGKKYPELYKKTKADAEKKQKLFQQICDEENRYREFFAQDRDAKEIADPYTFLVPVFKNEDIFNIEKQSAQENATPRIFALGDKMKTSGKAVVSKKDFENNFDVFTESQLRFMNWDNVFIAGGSVLACMSPPPPEYAKNRQGLRKYYHEMAFKSSDVDLFLYGLKSEQEANLKLAEIFEAVRESIHEEAIAFRSKHAVTIVSKYPYRHIQIVLRLYKSPAEILMGFDVDCCSVGYDGKEVWTTPRAQRAITHQYNTVDMSRRSPSYEMRLAKYGSRGFSVLVPSLNYQRIDPQLFERRFDQNQGLAKLLLLEKLEKPEYRNKYKEQQRIRKLRPEAVQRQSFYAQLDSTFNDEYCRERLEEGSADASDYSAVFLPWGPKWNSSNIRRLMYTKDMILNSQWYDPNKKIHTHPCFFGKISEIIGDCCGKCPPVAPEDEDPDSMYVSGKMSWLVVNPGQQSVPRIGSFHPITEGDWTEGAYISTVTETLCIAANCDDVAAAKRCIEQGTSLEEKDPVGRTPLHIAAFSNSVKVAKLLLDNKCRVSTRTIDGRTALHIAAQYGSDEVAALILEAGKRINEELQAKKEEEGGEDDEENEEDEEDEDEDDEDEFSIKKMLDKKKKQEEKEKAQMDPTLLAKEDDSLDLEATCWDLKMTALHYAIFFGRTKIVIQLLEAGASKTRHLIYKGDYKSANIPLLHLVSFNNKLEAGRALLERGIDVDVLSHDSRSALHIACGNLNYEFILLLMEYDADVNKVCNGTSPLQRAINSVDRFHKNFGKTINSPDYDFEADPISPEKLKIIKALINEWGAKVQFSEKDVTPDMENKTHNPWGNQKSGSTKRELLRNNFTQPIIAAANSGSLSLLKLLLTQKGVDVNWIASSKKTAVDIIEEKKKGLVDNKDKFANDEHSKKQLAAYRKQLATLQKKKRNKPAYLIRCLVIAINNMNKSRAKPTAIQITEAKQLRKQYDAILELLKSKGARKFSAIKLSAADKYLGSDSSYHNYYNNNIGEFKVTIKNMPEEIPGEYSYASAFLDEEQPKYMQLFDAIMENDIDKVRQLTIQQPVGKQVHVCCTNEEETTLILAAKLGNADMCKALLEIAKEQYTPLKLPVPEDDDHVPAINNYELAQLMRRIKPGEYLDHEGNAINNTKYVHDPNAPQVQLNCITSPSTYLKFVGNRWGVKLNVFHHVAKTGKIEVLDAMLAAINDLKLKNEVLGAKAKNPLSLLQVLLQERSRQGTPFEIAVASNNVKVAAKFLETGDAFSEVKEEEEVYEGLDVGGKKMDWALEHHAPQASIPKTTSLHIACANGADAAVKFLVADAPKIFEAAVKKMDDDDNELLPHFNIAHLDKHKFSVLHYSIYANKHNVITTILQLKGGKELLDQQDDFGATPLMHAVALDKKECVTALLKAKANVGLQDDRGWTALHFAVAANKVDYAKQLIAASKPEYLVVNSVRLEQNPLMVAAYYGHKECVELLLASNSVTKALFNKDAAGDCALQMAIKSGASSCVKLLLTKHCEIYAEENGVGLNALDCAMQVIKKELAGGQNEVLSAGAVEVLSHVESVQGFDRKIAETNAVRKLALLMLSQVEEQVNVEMRNRGNYKQRVKENAAFAGVLMHENRLMRAPTAQLFDNDEESDEESEDYSSDEGY